MADVYWEDLKVGDEITPKEATFTAAQLFQYSAVTNNTHRIHYDLPWAEHEGYEERVIHGPLQGELLTQTLVDWAGPRGWVKRVEYSNRRYAVLGETLTCKGTITELYQGEDGNHYADIEVYVEKGPKQVTAPGTATVMLPTRDHAISFG